MAQDAPSLRDLINLVESQQWGVTRSSIFDESLKENLRIFPDLVAKLEKFLDVKAENPLRSRYGKHDGPMTGPLAGFLHCHLRDDAILIYTLRNRCINLILICSHAEIEGKRQQKTRKRLSAYLESVVLESQQDGVFWHGSPSGELVGSHYGLHLGTHEAARQALESRIGVRADGRDWDGTQEYGKTLLAGRESLRRARGPYAETGFNCGLPEEDFYPHQRTYRASYSDGSKVSDTARPTMDAYRLVGPMTNTPRNPHEDFKANGYMKAAIKKGNAKRGYYYVNDGEDAGSISIVVPSMAHLEKVNA